MPFTWDETKRQANLVKHRVDFRGAIKIWDEPTHETSQHTKGDRTEMAKTVGSRPAKSKVSSSRSSTPSGKKRAASSRHGSPAEVNEKPSAYTPGGRDEDQTDWNALRRRTDEEIERGIAEDPDAAPMLDAAWFEGGTWVQPEPKTAISLRVDGDVLDFFKSSGPGYQTRMNAVLRAYMQHAKAKKPGKRRA